MNREHPHHTTEELRGLKAPDVLLGGIHALIDQPGREESL